MIRLLIFILPLCQFLFALNVSQGNAERVAAAATAVVSAAGTITSVVISDGGKGYTSAPTVTIQNPVGLGTTARAESTATIANGSVSAITVGVQSGIGYTGTNPPVVLIGAQPTLTESNTVVSFTGDSGVISGIAITTVGGITHPTIQLDLVVPFDSDLRNSNITQGVILMCSTDLTFQKFEVEGQEFIKLQEEAMKRVDLFYEMVSKR